MNNTAGSTTARKHYDNAYGNQLEASAEWLRFGAAAKADSVEVLLERHGIEPATLLELGCGTGAVIAECLRRGLGSELTAIDFSEPAIAYVASHTPGVHCIVADVTDPGFRLDQPFDVVVLSHVLEHLDEPLAFLQSLTRNVQFRYAVIEVPFEDLWAARVKNHFRDRLRNRAGHVQFFRESSFRQLLTTAGLEIEDHRIYAPTLSREALDFVCRKDAQTGVRKFVRSLTARYLPRLLGPVWERFYYAHYAVLCVRAGSTSGRT